MSFASKIEHTSRIASRRFGKGTICTILQGSTILDFIARNDLFPPNFFVSHKEQGYSTVHGMVLCVPSYNTSELESLMKDMTQESPEKKFANSIGPDAGQSLVIFLQQLMLLVYIGKPESISSLNSFDVLIDSIDVMGSISGTLVPKKKEDPNEGRSIRQ